MVVTFVTEHRDRFGVEPVLRVLDMPSSTYYDHVDPVPCEHDEVDKALLSNIFEVWDASGRTYGADRVHQQLRQQGIHTARKRVARLMTAPRAGRARSYAATGKADPRYVTRTPHPPRTWSTATSPRQRRTGCGSPTRPASPPAKRCCGWPPSATPTPGAS